MLDGWLIRCWRISDGVEVDVLAFLAWGLKKKSSPTLNHGCFLTSFGPFLPSRCSVSQINLRIMSMHSRFSRPPPARSEVSKHLFQFRIWNVFSFSCVCLYEVHTFSLVSSGLSVIDKNGGRPNTISYRITPTDHQSQSFVWPAALKYLAKTNFIHTLFQDDFRGHVVAGANNGKWLVTLPLLSRVQDLVILILLRHVSHLSERVDSLMHSTRFVGVIPGFADHWICLLINFSTLDYESIEVPCRVRNQSALYGLAGQWECCPAWCHDEWTPENGRTRARRSVQRCRIWKLLAWNVDFEDRLLRQILLENAHIDQKLHQIAAGNVFHYEVEVAFVLEREIEANDPFRVSFSQNISLCLDVGMLQFFCLKIFKSVQVFV